MYELGLVFTLWVLRIAFKPFVALWCMVRDFVLYLLMPRYRFGRADETVESTMRVQQWLARALYFGAFLLWYPSALTGDQFFTDLAMGLVEGVIVAGLALIPTWFLITVLARTRRWRTSVHALLPIFVALVTIVLVVLVSLMLALVVGVKDRLDPDSPTSGFLYVYVVMCSITVTMALLWYGVRAAADSYFRAIDGHPFMRPITLILLAAYMLVRGLIRLGDEGTDRHFPVIVGLGFVLLAPVAIGGLGLFELTRLRRAGLRIANYFAPDESTAFGPPPDVKPWILGSTPLFSGTSTPADAGPFSGSTAIVSPKSWLVATVAALLFASGVLGREAARQPTVAGEADSGSLTATPAVLPPTPLTAAGARPAGDLGLAKPMAMPACAGGFIVVTSSAIVPDQYRDEIEVAMAHDDDLDYVRTDTSCTSLRSQHLGNPIYIVFLGPFDDQKLACDSRRWIGGDSYVKRLDNKSPPDETVAC